jgi:hypothetical protein
MSAAPKSTQSSSPVVGHLAVRAFDPPLGLEYRAEVYPGPGVYQHPNGALVYVSVSDVKMLVGAARLVKMRS